MNNVVALSLANDFTLGEASLEKLIDFNEKLKVKFRHNLLFKLMETGQISSTINRDRFLNYLHVWSNYFQKAMLLKTALCDDPIFTSIFRQHFIEE